MLAVVKKRGVYLRYAPQILRGDKEVVMVAVQTGDALQFASPEMQADKEVVLAAIQISPASFQFASTKLRRDKDIIRTLMKRDYAAEGHYNNIHMVPVVGDYVTLVLKERQSNPVVHRVSNILPDGRVQLNNVGSIMFVL
jgi:hypothetical protein